MMRDECGIFGIWGPPDAAELTYNGLYALQHRGQESSGIVTADGLNMYQHRGLGLVNDVSSNKTLAKLKGHIAIGHNRYSTTGKTNLINIQPLLLSSMDGPLAMGHNGNLINTVQLHRSLESKGSIFQTTVDSEVIVHLIARSKQRSIAGKIGDALKQVKGAYSLIFLSATSVIAVKDPLGIRPMCLGRINDHYVVASESCAFDIIEAEYVREIDPGELVILDERGMRSVRIFPPGPRAHCIFEFVYFSRPDSRIFGINCDRVRRNLGRNLAEEHPADADIVIAVPDSSNTAALGYSERSGIRFELGLIRNHYVGRTFINPSQSMRDRGVRIKFNPVRGVLKNKRVVVVEDSIVRGTTLRKLTRLLRDAGAVEIHVRVSSSPVLFPCYYGIDMPTREELIASTHSVEEIRDHLGVDSLGYLSLDGMIDAAPMPPKSFCHACFSGEYAIRPAQNAIKHSLEADSLGKGEIISV
jgi:amidophosphoribosyltransferase